MNDNSSCIHYALQAFGGSAVPKPHSDASEERVHDGIKTPSIVDVNTVSTTASFPSSVHSVARYESRLLSFSHVSVNMKTQHSLMSHWVDLKRHMYFILLSRECTFR